MHRWVPRRSGQFDRGGLSVCPTAGSQRSDGDNPSRRTIRRVLLRMAMASGLAAGYGTLAAMAGRFLYSSPGAPRRWQFVATVDRWPVGHSISYVAPNGAKILVTRQHEGNSEDAFTALSSICPHLGCQVHWEPQNNRFFCPCHNGVFDRQGVAISGPPAAARQVLTRFPVKVDRGRLFILAPVTSVAEGVSRASRRTNLPGRATAFAHRAGPDDREA